MSYCSRCLSVCGGNATAASAPSASTWARSPPHADDSRLPSRHFTVAADLCARLEAPGWLSRVEIRHASMLWERGREGDRAEAPELAQRAWERADALHLDRITAEARTVLEEIGR